MRKRGGRTEELEGRDERRRRRRRKNERRGDKRGESEGQSRTRERRRRSILSTRFNDRQRADLDGGGEYKLKITPLEEINLSHVFLREGV